MEGCQLAVLRETEATSAVQVYSTADDVYSLQRGLAFSAPNSRAAASLAVHEVDEPTVALGVVVDFVPGVVGRHGHGCDDS